VSFDVAALGFGVQNAEGELQSQMFDQEI